MGERKTLIFDGALTEDTVNLSDFFERADYLYATSESVGDWSQTGEFVEVDFDLLITLEDGVKRRVPVNERYLSTREVVRIPQEYSRSGCLLEVALQASFSVDLKLWAVIESEKFDYPVRFDDLEQLLESILLAVGTQNFALDPDYLTGGFLQYLIDLGADVTPDIDLSYIAEAYLDFLIQQLANQGQQGGGTGDPDYNNP